MKIPWPQPKQRLRPCPLPATQSLPFSLLCNWLHLFPWLPCFVLSRSSHLSTTLLLLKLAVTLMSLYSGDSFQSIVLSVGFNIADHSPHLKPSFLLTSKTPHVLSLSLSGFSSLASLRGLSFSISLAHWSSLGLSLQFHPLSPAGDNSNHHFSHHAWAWYSQNPHRQPHFSPVALPPPRAIHIFLLAGQCSSDYLWWKNSCSLIF